MNFLVRILLIILVSGFFCRVSAQEIEWQNTFGGAASEWLRSIKPTTDGGYICGGLSSSNISGDKTEDSRGYDDYWVVKLDFAGNIQWQRTIGGSGDDDMYFVQQTNDGGYICGGNSNSNISGEKNENCKGQADYWIVKLDSSGIIQWQKTIGGSDFDYLYVVNQTTDGGYICGGISRSQISGDKTENGEGDHDFWIVKLDSVGSMQWQNTIGGNLIDYFQSLQQTNDGGYICGGSSESNISGDKTENSRGLRDYWIVKLDGFGNIQWQKTIGGSSHEELYAIEQTMDGGYICNGYSMSDISGEKNEVCQGWPDYWIIKLDSIGNIIWQNTIGGSSGDHGCSIKQLSDGSYICGGHSYSGISGDKSENIIGTQPDYWIIKLNEIGQIQWQNNIGGDDQDAYGFTEITNDGNFICGGSSISNISGDKTENSQGNYDYWVMKLTGNYNLMQGNVFFDQNSNNIQDSGETPIPYKLISESSTGRLGISDENGFYSVAVVDTGSFLLTPEIINYYNSVPAGHSAQFNTFFQTDSFNNFAFQPTGTFNDLCINITPSGAFRSGMNASYIINYTNQGTTTLSPNVIFYPDNNLSYVSSVPAATTIFPDSIIFAFGPLSPFQSAQIQVTVNVNPGLPIGTLINSGATILPVIGDANPACNSNYWEVLTTGSLDPNNILVNRDSLFNFELVNPESLEYIIRFQNTGNDTAFYVRVDNKISSDLQLNTFEFVSSSHPCSIEYQHYDSTMKFTFNNILLPDSNINESASHGFVRYKIKPQTSLQIGDSVRNSAGIYFDYNAPVWTNTAVTEIVLSTGLSHQEVNDNIQLLVYPNPVDQVLSVEIVGTSENNFIIDLYNMYGQKVNSLFNGKIPSGNRKIHFDVSELRSGMYFIKAEGSFSKPVRFIKY